MAYVAARRPLASGDITRYAAERLPDYMRPSRVVFLDALPLTPHGKIDRAALPAPERRAARDVMAPRDLIEMRLVAIWEDVLDARPIGVRDDFFDSGGHSLLAVRLMARVREAFATDLPLSDILRASTVERLADLLREGSACRSGPLVPLQAGGCRPTVFLRSRCGRQRPLPLQPGEASRHRPAVLRLAAGPRRRTGRVADQCRGDGRRVRARAIRSVQPRGPYAIGGHSLGAWVAFEMTQQLRARGERCRRWSR